jgi:hypothetical protein
MMKIVNFVLRYDYCYFMEESEVFFFEILFLANGSTKVCWRIHLLDCPPA